jgi:dienelactone hydrolase
VIEALRASTMGPRDHLHTKHERITLRVRSALAAGPMCGRHLDVEAAGLEHEIVVFPGVNHAFFNDTGPNHNANAAAQAYDRVLDWFGRFVDRGGQGG